MLRDHNLQMVWESSTYDKTVLASRVLVLGLGDQALTSIVVGLSLTTTAVLGLVATERKSVKEQLTDFVREEEMKTNL